MDNAKFWWSSSATPPDPPVPPVDLIGQSLRFRGAQELERTFGNPTNRQVWTWSGWVKLVKVPDNGQTRYVFFSGNGSNSETGWLDLGQEDDAPNAGNSSLFWTTSGTTDSSRPTLYRDFNAWMHVVYTYDGTTIRCFVNGEQSFQSASTGDRGVNGPHIHSIGNTATAPGTSGTRFFEGYMADVYFIDGQALQPTAFGRYNDQGVWIPREVDFTPAEMRNSDFLTITGGFTGANPAVNAFDGRTDTVASNGLSTGTITFAPNPGIPFNSIEVFMTNAGTNTCEHDGNTGFAAPNAWTEVIDVAGTIDANTPLTITNTSTNPQLAGIRITDANGTRILTNAFMWSANTFTGPNGSTGFDFDAREKNFGTGVNGINAGYDGNDNTFFFTQQNQSINVVLDLAGVNEVVVRTDQTQTYSFALNGTPVNAARVIDGSAARQTLELPNDFDGNVTMISIRGSSTTMTPGYSGIFINGQPLVDGINNSYGANGFHLDFADPDDIGADSSGNGNDFTESGFITNLISGGNLLGTVDTPANQQVALGTNPLGPIPFRDTSNVSQLYDLDLGVPVTRFSNRWRTTNMENRWIQIFSSETGAANSWTQIDERQFGPQANAAYDCIIDLPTPARFLRFSQTATEGAVWQPGVWNLQFVDDPDNELFDVMQDSPTQNYSTLQPLGFPGGRICNCIQPSNGNLSTTATSNPDIGSTIFQMPARGRYAMQINGGATDEVYVQLLDITDPQKDSAATHGAITKERSGGDFRCNAGLIPGTPGIPSGSGDVDPTLQILVDCDTQNMWVGDFQGNFLIQTPVGGSGTLTVGAFNLNTPTLNYGDIGTDGENLYMMFGHTIAGINYGQQPWAVALPDDSFNHLQTQNMPEATITNGRDHFRAITGPGTASDGGVAGQLAGGWSSALTSPTGFQDPLPPTGAFDNNASTQAGTNGNGTSMVFAPTTDINVTELAIFTQMIAGGTLEWNGNTVNTLRDDWTIITDTGVLNAGNPMTLTADPSSTCTLIQVRINGDILVDASILAQAQQTFPQGLWWIKSRVTDGNINEHQLVDSVRGADQALQCPNVGPQTNYIAPAGDSVAWCWNFDNANPATNGFEIIQYAGNGTSQTINHRLGATPEFIITQPINGNAADTPSISVWHVGFGNDQHFMRLNDSASVSTGNTEMWNNIGATSYDVGSDPKVNLNSANMIAYVWTSVPGYSAFGTYESNVTDDGPFVYLGFKPALVITTNMDQSVTQGFTPKDTTRAPFNLNTGLRLSLNQASAETTHQNESMDLLSNGFKIRGTSDSQNAPDINRTFIYMAWAENPFGGSNVSPANAR